MKDDNRIVPGSELDLDKSTLDNVLAGTSVNPQLPTPDQDIDFGQKYTLADRLVEFLNKSLFPNDLINHTKYVDLERRLPEKMPPTHDLIKNPSFEKVVRTLGPSGLGFNGFGYLNWPSGSSQYSDEKDTVTVAKLGVTEKISGQEFGKLVKLLLGEELYKHFMSTDVAVAIGADDKTRMIELGNPLIIDYFPDLRRLSTLGGEYLMPHDPYLLLLGLKPENRKLLSAAFDIATEQKEFPFVEGARVPYRRNGRILDYVAMKAETENLLARGLVGIKSLMAAASKYGVKEIKPYLDDISNLRERLGKAPTREQI